LPDFEAAFHAILGRFKDQMDSLRPNVPIAWPNLPYDPLEDFSAASHDAWARITIRGGDARIASAGAVGHRRWRHVGVVIVQVFTVLGRGAAAGLAVADDVAHALRGTTVNGVALNAAAIEPVGQDEVGGFFQTNVRVAFRYDYNELLRDLDDFVADAGATDFGTWQNPLLLGGTAGLYIWYVSGAEYAKTGAAPTHETDGTERAAGAVV